MSPSLPHDHLAIQNVLARYCQALDTKSWALLHSVFLPDVQADYPFNRSLRGCDAVSAAIQGRLGPIRTHHSLTTQRITFGDDGRSATAVTYFVGCHFGQGKHEGEVLTAYGVYTDELVVEEGEDCEGVRGASGRWRVGKRTVGFTQRIGDEGIMREF